MKKAQLHKGTYWPLPGNHLPIFLQPANALCIRKNTSGRADVGAHQQCGTAASAAAPVRWPALPGGNARLGCAAQTSQTPFAGECTQWFLVLLFPAVSGLHEAKHRTRHSFTQICFFPSCWKRFFFPIQMIHFSKQYIRFPEVNYSICSVWGAEFQLLKKSGIPLYLWKQIPYPYSTWVPNCQTQRRMKGSGRNAAKSQRAVHNNKHVTLTLNMPSGAVPQACGTPAFHATCVLNSRNNPKIKSEGRQCAHWAML